MTFNEQDRQRQGDPSASGTRFRWMFAAAAAAALVPLAAAPVVATDRSAPVQGVRVAAPAPAPEPRWGGAMVSGRRWLQGRGVDVLRGRQCTELATRLYRSRRWGPLDNIYGLRPGRLYGRMIRFHRNGSGYVPVPGDVLVELGGSYQHVAVVDRVTRRAIHTVEQNAVPSGRHVYRWNGRNAFGAYGPRHVGGFIHSSRNRIGLPARPKRPPRAPSATPTAPGARA